MRKRITVLASAVLPLLLLLIHLSPPSTPQPLGDPGDWKLKFDDEFNGSSVNKAHWNLNWFGATSTTSTVPVNPNLEVDCYNPKQSAVGGGALKITAVKRNCAGYKYASDLLNTDGHFQFTYGFLEARMYLPGNGTGGIANWPAFWADGQEWPVTGENDVMEGLGGPVSWHFHWGTAAHPQQVGRGPAGNYSGWHTFAADWEPGAITYYYDGVNVGRVTANVTSAPMYLILDYALTNRRGTVRVPSTMSVDYVRVWQHH
ncbi:MAG: glycoside hydrolase family 16 protein [Solirubrobacterales bacterium]|nr:glycoside hydrolase family 16 protein [Solirubrobacterales bacterium]MBV9716400.1 glycoside hydrolase family 16 protein [Solirubrobacterales bacterium]